MEKEILDEMQEIEQAKSPLDQKLDELEPYYKIVAEVKANIDNLNAIMSCTFLSDEQKLEAITTITDKTAEKLHG